MKKEYLLKISIIIFPLLFYAQSDFDCSSLMPIVENTEINICVPGGAIQLEAQMNTGNRIYWYDSEASETPIGEGVNFEIEVYESTSIYGSEAYVEIGGNINKLGLKTDELAENDGFISNPSEIGLGLTFEAENPFIIVEVDVFSFDQGGDINVELHDESGQVIESKNFTISSGGTQSNRIKHTLTLDFEVPHKGIFHLVHTKGEVKLGLTMDGSFTYPISLGDFGNLIDGYHYLMDLEGIGAFIYPIFYNWSIQTLNTVCESEREKIIVQINDDYPEVLDIEDKIVLCGNGGFIFADVNIDNAYKLQFYNNDGEMLNSDFSIEEDTLYYVSEVSKGGCIGDFVEIKFIFQDISDSPIAEALQSFEEGSDADLTSLEVEGENLRWYADEDKEEELPEDTLLEDNMTYYVSQTLEENCESDLIVITVTETLGVADVCYEGLEYNNPVQDILYLSNDVEIESISVYDLSGRQLSIVADKLSSTELRMDLSGLSAGVYFFNLHVNEGTKMIKIVKQ